MRPGSGSPFRALAKALIGDPDVAPGDPRSVGALPELLAGDFGTVDLLSEQLRSQPRGNRPDRQRARRQSPAPGRTRAAITVSWAPICCCSSTSSRMSSTTFRPAEPQGFRQPDRGLCPVGLHLDRLDDAGGSLRPLHRGLHRPAGQGLGVHAGAAARVRTCRDHRQECRSRRADLRNRSRERPPPRRDAAGGGARRQQPAAAAIRAETALRGVRSQEIAGGLPMPRRSANRHRQPARLLTLAAYRGFGGIAGAIDTAAEAAIGKVSDANPRNWSGRCSGCCACW